MHQNRINRKNNLIMVLHRNFIRILTKRIHAFLFLLARVHAIWGIKQNTNISKEISLNTIHISLLSIQTYCVLFPFVSLNSPICVSFFFIIITQPFFIGSSIYVQDMIEWMTKNNYNKNGTKQRNQQNIWTNKRKIIVGRFFFFSVIPKKQKFGIVVQRLDFFFGRIDSKIGRIIQTIFTIEWKYFNVVRCVNTIVSMLEIKCCEENEIIEMKTNIAFCNKHFSP